MASSAVDLTSDAISATAPRDTGCNHSATVQLSDLPNDFPEVLNSSFAWTGSEMTTQQYECLYDLSASDIQELVAALQHFKSLGLGGDEVSRSSFPLPSLGVKLGLVSHNVHSGRGFALVRGLNPKKYPVEDLTILHLGIQVYVADKQGRQDRRGNMLVHIVADHSTAQKAAHNRHSNHSIAFHNEEAGDLISWFTRSTAAAGGRCVIASGHTIYNVLAASRPDIIRTLARSDWPFALPRFKCRPILFNHDGKLIINFGRAPLMGSEAHPRRSNQPSLTPCQTEALDAIEAIATATQFEIQTRPGDIHFINNLVLLHRREGFVDGQGPQEKRHLVRMLLRDSQLGWSIPEELQREWYDAFEKNADKAWHLEPMPGGFFPLRINPN